MLKKILLIFIIFILIISCRKPFRPTLNSLGAPPSDPNSPVIDETPEESYIVKADDTEAEIAIKIQKYYEENQEYAVILEDTKENIEANNTLDTINALISKEDYSQGVLLDLTHTDITTIKENAFKDNANLMTVKLPDTITTIANHAFNNCKKLETVNFPSSLTTIGMEAFRLCSSLKEVNLKYTKIAILYHYVFSDCANLSAVTLPDGLLGMENGAFSYCTSLEEITFPDGFLVIGNNVFAECRSLKKVKFNTKLKSIYNYAFSGCTSLSQISLPISLEKLGDSGMSDIFPNCTSLSDVEYLGTNPEAITYFNNVFAASNPQNLYLPNVEAPTDPAQDPNPWNNFLGYNWANKIQYKTSMPSN